MSTVFTRRGEQSMEERFLGTGAVEPTRERRTDDPRVRWLLAGLGRFFAITAAAAAAAAGLGVLVGLLRDADLARSVVLGFYAGGALLILFAALRFSSGQRRWVGEYGEDLGPGGGGDTGALIAVGLVLVGIGVLLDSLTG